ncbi:Nuclease subunit C protein [Rutstroemia sp. NJR-2017a BVV2]|nr:Nuclease subunit C protein [Rutstroemia sp. NJR-2017a BVV2]
MSTNVSAFTTAIGWLVLIGAAGAYWYYNANKVKSKVKATTPAKQISKAFEDRKEPKSKKAKKDGGLSNGDQDAKTSEKKMKPQNPRKPEQKRETPKFVDVDTDNDDDAESNRKFALQFAQAQAGTKFSSTAAAGNRQKSVKQSRAQEKQKAESGNMTAGSATAGDADDDQSFTDSPEVGPTGVVSPVSNGISDMLEAPAPGPSVIKVTEPTNPQPAKKEKAKPAPAPVETKKQRQNRAKVEAARIAREEEEKERKIKEEKQRRTAREAEGRAPKDGRQFMASQQPQTSAWTGPSANGGSTGKFDLLDTTEDTSSSTPTVPAKSENTSESKVGGSSWVDDDERVKSAIEESREWSQVQSKKRKTKKENKENTNGEGAGATSSTDEKEFTAPPVTSRTGLGQKWTSDLPQVNNDKVQVVPMEAQDSEWVVS